MPLSDIRILIIDDDPDQQALMRRVLGTGPQVMSALSLAEARIALGKNPYDLILLDVHLPDGNGLNFLSELKGADAWVETPVIFITAEDQAPSEVMGFSLGAEDYVVKPIVPGRFKARIEARIKQLQSKKVLSSQLSRPGLTLNLASQRATLTTADGERVLELTPVEFKLLHYLLAHEDHVLSREQILAAVWPNASDVFERTVDMHVSNLRKKLAGGEFHVKAVHGSGYRLSRTQS